ncbi:hypothetical protein PXK01_16580 [Phaeobacter sp. PT47_59]|uniref:hypothetical protein n=1 Tax=Phaeobacter sp. PT47_59 TaxID=3029979 RepID=UPI00237FEF44|nr:hypothetical protein [Phaeobacter sp. PT47_59]MDE4175780.1 hypothetical protein [Phaeobacter sp. PT47_59]
MSEPTTQEPVFDYYALSASHAALTAPPVGASLCLKDSQGRRWSVELPIGQAHEMERAGFEIHWIMPNSDPADID